MNDLIKKTVDFLEKINEKQSFPISEFDNEFSRFLVLFYKIGFLNYEIKDEVCNIKLNNKTINDILSEIVNKEINKK